MQYNSIDMAETVEVPAIIAPPRLRLPVKPLAPQGAPLWIIARVPESVDEHRYVTVYTVNGAPTQSFVEWLMESLAYHNVHSEQRVNFDAILAHVDHTWPRTERWRVIAACTAYGVDWSRYWYRDHPAAIDALIARQRDIARQHDMLQRIAKIVEEAHRG